MTPEITKFHACNEPGRDFTVVARWRARVGDFNIRDGSLRRFDNGTLAIGLPGYRSGGIGLYRDGQVFADLEKAVMKLYAWESAKTHNLE